MNLRNARFILLMAVTTACTVAELPAPEDTTNPTDTATVSETTTPDDTVVQSDASVTEDSTSPSDSGAAIDTVEDTTPSLEIGEGACCLSMSGDRVVWAENGVIWLYDRANNTRRIIVESPGEATEPTLSGNRLVWADNRKGDFDLWTMDLSDEIASPLIERPGHQTEPTLWDNYLAWVSVEKGDMESMIYADIWAVDLNEPETVIQITNDDAEQSQPFLRDGKIVWTDYSSDPDKAYMPISNPTLNNADILGYDLNTDAYFIVTQDPAKQSRAVIENNTVVWLDWRGINPEPKYSEFQVYGTEIGSGVDIKLGVSSWATPELWERPALDSGRAVWIAEPVSEPLQTGIFIMKLEDAASTNVLSFDGRLEGLATHGGQLAWMTDSEIGVADLSVLTNEDDGK